MNLTLRLLALALLFLSTSALCASKSWRGIVPVHSTRADVNRILGPSPDFNKLRANYSLGTEDAYIVFSNDESPQYCAQRLPTDTVLLILVTPKTDLQLSDFQLDKERLRTFEPGIGEGFIDDVNGLVVRMLKGWVEQVGSFANSDDQKLCPEFYANIEDALKLIVDAFAIKFDEYANIRFSDERARLDNFAIQLQSQPESVGYFIFYSGRDLTPVAAKARSNRARTYLTKTRGVTRLVVIDGGRRKEFSVELFLQHRDLPSPTPNPDVVRQAFPTAGQPRTIDALINDFVSSDWQKVSSAKELLESRQAEAIPRLLQILERDEKVELDNTADLIYPGAKQFYGHGRILDYDVDFLSVRAGWALEELTFQSFGLGEGAIREADLMKAVLARQSNVRLTDHAKTPEIKKQLRAEAIARVRTWWQNVHASWNRFDAILEALKSDDPIRQERCLSWIRYGRTKCDGLTIENFKRYIVPEATRLLKSKDEAVRVRVKYLLEDKDAWWLKYKNANQH